MSTQATPAERGHEAEVQELRQLYEQLLASWNSRNGEAFAALFTDDGNLIGFDGSQVDWRAAIATHLSTIFSDHPTAAYVGIVREVRLLAPDIALLRAVAGMVPPGPAQSGHQCHPVPRGDTPRRDVAHCPLPEHACSVPRAT